MKLKYIALLVLPFFIGCEGDEDSITHNQGKDCIACHSNFTSAGTIFSKIDASDNDSSNVNDSYNIRLTSNTGVVVSFESGRGRGNKKIQSSLSSFDTFTAEVVDASSKVVNSSNKNSHTNSRFRCNTCHSKSGINGAPGRIVGFDYTNSLKANIK